MTVPRAIPLVLSGLLIALAPAAPGGVLEAQDEPSFDARDAVYFELGGNGLLYTLNYERRLRDHIAGRAGIMFFTVEGTTSEGEKAEASVLVAPIMLNGLLGGGAGRLELGVGPLFGWVDAQARDIEGTEIDVSGFGIAGVTSTIGYRYHPPDGGLLFRIGLTPFISGDPQIWGGIGIGYAF